MHGAYMHIRATHVYLRECARERIVSRYRQRECVRSEKIYIPLSDFVHIKRLAGRTVVLARSHARTYVRTIRAHVCVIDCLFARWYRAGGFGRWASKYEGSSGSFVEFLRARRALNEISCGFAICIYIFFIGILFFSFQHTFGHWKFDFFKLRFSTRV